MAAAVGLRDAYEGTGLDGGVPVRLRDSSGAWRFAIVEGSHLDDGSGEPSVVLVTRLVSGTERTGAQAELERLSTIIRAQQDASPDGVLVVSPIGHTISYNRKFLELWGFTVEEADSSFDVRARIISAQLRDPKTIHALVQRIYAEPLGTFEAVVELIDGRFLEAHTAPLASAAEEIYGRIWYYRDVTERVKGERDLRESEDRYRRLVELSPNAIGVHQEGVIRYVNEAGRHLLNATDEQLIGSNVFALVHPGDHPAVVSAALERDFERPRFVEVRMRAPDGRELIVELASSQTTFDGTSATQTVMRDITERRKAEAALRQSEDRYRNLVESTPDPIYVHDGRAVVYANPACAALFGFGRPEEMVGLDPYELLGGIERSDFDERTARVLGGETLRFAGRRFLVHKAIEVEIEIVISPAMLEERPVVQALIRDVTERLRAEEDRLALERKMLEAQKLESLGVLAGGVAHDFNNLLVAIMGNTSLALMELPEDSPMRHYLAEIETASQRAADLARQMLAYSGKGRFVIESMDISASVREMANLLSVSLPAKAGIEFDLEQSLPRVEADPTQVRQVIMNLVINGAEAIDEEGGQVLLKTSVRYLSGEELALAHPHGAATPGRFVSLTVQDTGHGMDRTTLDRIFDPFFTTKFTGRGLGLAAVLGIVRGHRGAMFVSSAPGVGTTFELLLPVAEI